MSGPSRPVRNRVVPTKRFEASMTGKYHGFSGLQVMGANPGEVIEYDEAMMPVIAKALLTIKDTVTFKVTKNKSGSKKGSTKKRGSNFLVTYSLKKGLEKFKENGEHAAVKELKQMHDRVSWQPIHKKTMSPSEKRKIMRSLIFLAPKESVAEGCKARHCADGTLYACVAK